MFRVPLHWPTILTLAMFPRLVWMYLRLAQNEEREARREFGREYEQYAAVTAPRIPGPDFALDHWPCDAVGFA